MVRQSRCGPSRAKQGEEDKIDLEPRWPGWSGVFVVSAFVPAAWRAGTSAAGAASMAGGCLALVPVRQNESEPELLSTPFVESPSSSVDALASTP